MTVRRKCHPQSSPVRIAEIERAPEGPRIGPISHSSSHASNEDHSVSEKIPNSGRRRRAALFRSVTVRSQRVQSVGAVILDFYRSHRRDGDRVRPRRRVPVERRIWWSGTGEAALRLLWFNRIRRSPWMIISPTSDSRLSWQGGRRAERATHVRSRPEHLIKKSTVLKRAHVLSCGHDVRGIGCARGCGRPVPRRESSRVRAGDLSSRLRYLLPDDFERCGYSYTFCTARCLHR